MKQDESIRSDCDCGRIQYDPKWCKSKPYKVFLGGTAINAYPSLQEALDRLASDKIIFTKIVWK